MARCHENNTFFVWREFNQILESVAAVYLVSAAADLSRMLRAHDGRPVLAIARAFREQRSARRHDPRQTHAPVQAGVGSTGTITSNLMSVVRVDRLDRC
jgi:hypothetical protein